MLRCNAGYLVLRGFARPIRGIPFEIFCDTEVYSKSHSLDIPSAEGGIVKYTLAILFTLASLPFCAAASASDQQSPAPRSSPSPEPSSPCGGPGRLLATANRPTIGYSACAVKQHTAVFELGYQNQVDGTPSSGSIRSQVPQNFLRLGIIPNFEIDVIGPNYEATRSYSTGRPDTVTNGVADSGLGFKYELPPMGKWTIAFDGLYTGPNGSTFLTAGNATWTGNFDASYSLSPATSIGTTVAVSSTGGYADNVHGQYGTTMPSVVVTTQIPHYYQFYAEYVLVSKIALDRGDRAFTDFGVQKLLGTRTEVDVEYGHAFTGISALKFNYVGAGLVLQLR